MQGKGQSPEIQILFSGSVCVADLSLKGRGEVMLSLLSVIVGLHQRIFNDL